jgi:hypothetical protein
MRREKHNHDGHRDEERRPYAPAHDPPTALCVDGEVFEFVSGTTRVFRLNDDAIDRGTLRDVPGDEP